jgi:asparagine synthase (glutamine-hydrolysing)
MCGITGILSDNFLEKIDEKIRAITSILSHRGPDFQDTWLSENKNIALGHARLSILDLSFQANQPMISHNSRWIIVFNGEIYNHLQIRTKLTSLNVSFKTTSDTETLLEAVSHWGVEKTLDEIQGMFSFSVWDQEKESLYLCRDRFGIKPIYWTYQNKTLIFGSELKCIMKSCLCELVIDPDSLSHLLDFGYIPSPLSIFKDVYKLEPGMFLHKQKGKPPVLRKYWTLPERLPDAPHDPNSINALDFVLHDSVKEHIISDVPLGSFLSGGLDSSLITAIAQNYVNRPIQTFTVGYEEKYWDESDKASQISRHLGTEHTEYILKGQDVQTLVALIPEHYDEPFADFSQLPTLALSHFARQSVTVCLSGDGGDELFGGYTRYGWSHEFWMFLSRFPKPLRVKILSYLKYKKFNIPQANLLPSHINTIFRELSKKTPFGYDIVEFQDLYQRILKTGSFSLHNNLGYVPLIPQWAARHSNHLLDQMQDADFRHYMSDGVLTKVDRASMSIGLEVRTPFLYEPVVEFSRHLSIQDRYKNHSLRVLQKKLAERYLPKDIINAPKMGFGFPVDTWLCTTLKDFAEDLLQPQELKKIPYLEQEKITLLWEQHKSGHSENHWQIWPVLMFVQWYRKWEGYISTKAF